jgi:uncharacterized protein (DUF488 family)
MIRLFTIGFAGKSAEQFFSLLQHNNVKTVVDTRLNNTSQLSGFAKADDLKYFLKQLADIDYMHSLAFAPTKDLLDKSRKNKFSWEEYETAYIKLLEERNILQATDIDALHNCCLLCSEHSPENCHRRLLAEYLKAHRQDILIVHLTD